MRYLLLLLIAFALGFLVRDYTGPVKLPVSLWTVKQIVNPEISTDTVPGNVQIIYNNGTFSPTESAIAAGRWLTIINKSDSLMWLTSKNTWLSTPRGYGLNEQIQVRMDETGEYRVKNKLNTKAELVIKVVP